MAEIYYKKILLNNLIELEKMRYKNYLYTNFQKINCKENINYFSKYSHQTLLHSLIKFISKLIKNDYLYNITR